MDIWISWCKRDSKCRHCEETITPGTRVVIGKHWRPGKFTIMLRWHPQCWLQQGLNYLEKNPYTSHKLQLDEEQSIRRHYLLVRYATCKHRLQAAASVGGIRTIKSLIEKMQV